MKARVIIAVISIPLVILGVVLAFDLTKMFGIPISVPEWGYTLFSLGADIAVVYLLIEFLLLREERQRWSAVEGKAKERVQHELFEVFSLVFSMLTPPIDLSSSKEEKMSRMRELVAEPRKLSTMTIPELDSRLGHSLQFDRTARRIGDLEIRYSSKLDPRLINILMEIEDCFDSLAFLSLDPTLNKTKWVPLLNLIEALLKGVDSGLIELPYMPPPEREVI
jgi:hypothetical protein